MIKKTILIIVLLFISSPCFPSSGSQLITGKVDINSPLTPNLARIKIDSDQGISVSILDIVGATTTATVISSITGERIRIIAVKYHNYSTTTDGTIELKLGTQIIDKFYISAKSSLGWDRMPFLSNASESLVITTTGGNIHFSVSYLQGTNP